MKNPEIRNERTPNGGVSSEFWYFDKDGNPTKTIDSAVSFKILEFDASGGVIQTTYGKL